MVQKSLSARTAGAVFLLALAACAVFAPAAAAAPGNASMAVTPGPELNVTWDPAHPPEFPAQYAPSPTPVTIFRAELNNSTLPGPRYMGFGPSIIGISADPRLLAVCFAVVLVALVAWFIGYRRRGKNSGGEKPEA